MNQGITDAAITIGELEANYSLYCKALRILVREEKSLKKLKRTVCWGRLQKLHECMPKLYRDPEFLVQILQRQPNQGVTG